MSFELSLFKLYERSLGGCADEIEAQRREGRRCLRRTLRGCSCLCVGLFGLSMLIAGAMHALVVDKVGCMGVALSTAAEAWANTLNVTATPAGFSFPPETVIRVSFLLNSSSVTSAWATGSRLGGPIATNNSSSAGASDANAALWVWSGSRKTQGAGPRVWTRWTPPSPAPAPAPAPNPSNGTSNSSSSGSVRLLAQPRSSGAPESEVYASSVDAIVAGDATHSPDYLASSRSEPVTMGQAQRTARGYPVLNLTVPLVCGDAGVPGTSSLLLSLFTQASLWFYVVDTDALALNSFIRSLPLWPSGWMVSSVSGEAWSWNGLQRVEETWGLEPVIEVASLPDYPWFSYPSLTRQASGAWLFVLHLSSKFYYFLLALLALYVATTSAAMLLREVCSHGTGAIFVVLAAFDSCRRPSRIFSGLCGCVTNAGTARSAAAARRDLVDHHSHNRLRQTLSTHSAKTCPTLFALFLCCCGTCVCCPCCDLVTPSDWTASRVRRPRRRRPGQRGPHNTAGDLLVAAGVVEAQQRDRERFYDDDDDDDEEGEEGEREAQQQGDNEEAPAPALENNDVERGEATMQQARPASSTAATTARAPANGGREAPRAGRGDAESSGDEEEDGEGEGEGDGEQLSTIEAVESNMMRFAWFAATAFYPWFGDAAQQVRGESTHEEARLRLQWARWTRGPEQTGAETETETTARRRRRPVARSASFSSSASSSSTSENDRTALMPSSVAAPSTTRGRDAVAVAVGGATATAEGAAAMPAREARAASAGSVESAAGSAGNGNNAPSSNAAVGATALRRSRFPIAARASAAVEPAFIAACGWCCCRPLVASGRTAPAPSPPSSSSALARRRAAAAAGGSWLHPAWWRQLTREQLSFAFARWQGVLWALAAFLSLLGVFGSGTIELKSHPTNLALSLWSVILVAEYWSLLYARTVTSMLVFSRVVTYSFVACMLYWLSYQYPPMGAPVAAFTFLVAATMVLLISEAEAPALAFGKVSASIPRQALAVEGWGSTGRALTIATAATIGLQGGRHPDTNLIDEDGTTGWHAFRSLPHSFTLFHPITTRLDRIEALQPGNRPGLHDLEVPPLPTQQEQQQRAEGEAAPVTGAVATAAASANEG